MSILWHLLPLFSALPVILTCCFPRQIRFDILVRGQEKYEGGEGTDYSENRTFFYDEIRNCTLLRGAPFGSPMEIFSNYSSGIEYSVFDQCEMRVINGRFNKMCLPSNAVLQRKVRIPLSVREVSVYRANISDYTGVLQREYGVIHEGDSCYFLWSQTEGILNEFGLRGTFSETLTYKNIQTLSENDPVFEIPGKCHDV